ncbi:helix-turn-helix domain-containing protein [Pseudoramibacter faecis]|uniref:helix-turn-helix domain-containing protein n=1 Tax=Pseudoramibacter faecis TaxID=3108534 RepID=UPI002E7A153C|nr:helix-turn-helix domain-containing protein [Pseudoramibacter sp. HA2172]
MSELYNSIMAGLNEAAKDAQGKTSLKRNTVTVVPVKRYSAEEVKNIRKDTGMSQRVFAEYMGVSNKTVEAWEAGKNHPSGAASRILSMMEINHQLIKEYPFVTMG